MLISEAIFEAGYRAGLHSVGVCSAEPFTDTERILCERKQEGLHGSMQFTYRNPQRSTNPKVLLPDAKALIVGALDYYEPMMEPPDDDSGYARVAAYSRRDYYAVLREALSVIVEMLVSEGYSALAVADENHLVDRAAAYRAGIGWRGKSANILVRGAGSMVVLGSVVTNAPVAFEHSEPVQDGCGTCSRCISCCPTSAIVAPGVVDARRCLAWLLQRDGVFDPRFRVALGDRIYGCDVCSDVCPPNKIRFLRSAREGNRGENMLSAVSDNTAFDNTALNGWVSVMDILSASDSELLASYGRWYIPKRQPKYLRRNALIVLGNVGDPNSQRVREVVNHALADPDPIVAAHAVWCARRLGLGLDALVNHNDPLIVDELKREVPIREVPLPGVSLREVPIRVKGLT